MPKSSTPLWIPLLLVAIAASTLLLRGGSDPDTGAVPNCEATTSDVRVKIGDTLFSVPRDYAPNIYVPEGKVISRDRMKCQGSEDAAFEADSLSITPKDKLPFQAEPDALTEPVWNVQIIIKRFPQTFDGPERASRWALEQVEEQGLKIDDLPNRNGFKAFDNAAPGEHFYFARPGSIDSTDPVPFVIACLPREISSGDSRLHYGRRCRTDAYYTFRGELRLYYRFYDAHHPIETWRDLDAAVRAFIQSLVVENDN